MVECPLLARSGHRLLRCTCLLLTQSDAWHHVSSIADSRALASTLAFESAARCFSASECEWPASTEFRLTESSAILKYLADKYDLPSYPKDLKKRAKVNEVMDWLNTQFYRDFGYGLIYPQLFPHHKRRSDEAHAGAIAWGQQGAKNWLQILNDHWIGPKNKYLCGDELSIADYFGAAVVSIGDLIGCDLSVYPNIKRWLDNMKKLKSWDQVNEVFNGFVAANKGKELVRV